MKKVWKLTRTIIKLFQEFVFCIQVKYLKIFGKKQNFVIKIRNLKKVKINVLLAMKDL